MSGSGFKPNIQQAEPPPATRSFVASQPPMQSQGFSGFSSQLGMRPASQVPTSGFSTTHPTKVSAPCAIQPAYGGTLSPYSPMSALSAPEIAAYKSQTFTVGEVPTRPPSKELVS
jgi:hypothetical protein